MEKILNQIKSLRKKKYADTGSAKLRAISATIISKTILENKKLSQVLSTQQENQPDLNWSWIKQACFGTLRHLNQLQLIVHYLIPKPLPKKNHDLFCLILVGLYQLEYMNTPAYASVNETVAATKIIGKTWAKGLCNKVLRRYSKQRDKIHQHFKDNLEFKYSHPLWLIEEIAAAWPDYWQDILLNNNTQAPLFLRVNKQHTSKNDYLALLRQQDIAFHSNDDDNDDSVRLDSALPVNDIPGFTDGLVSVQDKSGQRIVSLLNLQPGQKVLDACAAPGSKTCHILESEPSLSKLIAVDINADRLLSIKQNLIRLKLPSHTFRLTLADATHTKEWWDGELFDCILLDAPCSSLGVIRRHPDIKHLRSKQDILDIMQLQQYLLRSLWPLLAPSGRLVYTTCSILPDENENQIKQFLTTHKDAKAIMPKVQNSVVLKFGCQNLPQAKAGDGFYYSILTKQ